MQGIGYNLSVLFGLLAGSRPGAPLDRAISTVSVLVVSLPEFVVAALLVFVLSWQLGWFEPVSLTPTGNVFDRPSAMVLPALSVTLVGAAFVVRLARAAIADVGRLPHVESARLQGVPEHRVLLRYVLPSALGPIAQVLSFVAIFLIGGTIIVEQFFDCPGLGKLLVGSVRARDLPVVEGIGLLLARAVVLSVLVAGAARRAPARAAPAGRRAGRGAGRRGARATAAVARWPCASRDRCPRCSPRRVTR